MADNGGPNSNLLNGLKVFYLTNTVFQKRALLRFVILLDAF